MGYVVPLFFAILISSKFHSYHCIKEGRYEAANGSIIDFFYVYKKLYSSFHGDFLMCHNQKNSPQPTVTCNSSSKSISYEFILQKDSVLFYGESSLNVYAFSCAFCQDSLSNLYNGRWQYSDLNAQPNSSFPSYKRSVVIIGDSLLGQLYTASRCQIENIGYNNNELPIYYINDKFLRSDLPCSKSCSAPKEYTTTTTNNNNNSNNTISTKTNKLDWRRNLTCLACDKNGNRRNISKMSLDDQYPWLKTLPNNTGTIVIGSGAWYNYFQGFINVANDYIEALKRIGPILSMLINKRRIHIYWLELPPMILSLEHKKSTNKDFGWQSFQIKNQMAKEILKPFGVHFLAINNILYQRKIHDDHITFDNLHWCTPGEHSIPSFIFSMLMHIEVITELTVSANE
eukprot:gene7279-14837_t